MHEASIIHSVLEIAFTHLRRHGGARLQRVRLRVGALAGVVPEALEFAFEALKLETPAAQATLEVEWVPARLHCLDCGLDYDAAQAVELCPRCGSWRSDAQRGQELDVVSLELAPEN
jgi:hydrogenase nickel incorporation protein HypA/HybF